MAPKYLQISLGQKFCLPKHTRSAKVIYQAEAANGVVGELRQKEQHVSTLNEKHIRG